MKIIKHTIALAMVLGLVHVAWPKEGDKMRIPGSQLKACAVALQEFNKRKDTPEVANYNVEVTEAKDSYEISFIPILSPGESPPRGGRTKLGEEVHYIVSRDMNVVIREYFGR